MIELKSNPEPLVRSIVAGVLAWVDGPEADRARGELLTMLADRAPSVRIAAASSAWVRAGDASLPRLLEALRQESDVGAAYAMVDAILRLDPDGGRKRIDDVAAASASARPAIEAALRLRK